MPRQNKRHEDLGKLLVVNQRVRQIHAYEPAGETQEDLVTALNQALQQVLKENGPWPLVTIGNSGNYKNQLQSIRIGSEGSIMLSIDMIENGGNKQIHLVKYIVAN